MQAAPGALVQPAHIQTLDNGATLAADTSIVEHGRVGVVLFAFPILGKHQQKMLERGVVDVLQMPVRNLNLHSFREAALPIIDHRIVEGFVGKTAEFVLLFGGQGPAGDNSVDDMLFEGFELQ